MQAREPENVAEVRSFLGLANFSCRFIPQFATLSESLRQLTKKDVIFHYGPEQRRSFEALKKSLSRAGTLANFDKKASTNVIADASHVGLGAVLVQEQHVCMNGLLLYYNAFITRHTSGLKTCSEALTNIQYRIV